MIQEKIREALKPIIDEALEEAYKKGAEDTIRRFAFVYDTIAQTAKRDAYAEVGAIDIEELDEELSQTVFDDIEPLFGEERVKRSEVLV